MRILGTTFCTLCNKTIIPLFVVITDDGEHNVICQECIDKCEK